jgi:hypothetical protein
VRAEFAAPNFSAIYETMSTYASEITIVEFMPVERGATGGGEVVIACLGCLLDREVPDGQRVGACPGCNYVGWSRIEDLARDDLWWELHPLPEPRLDGDELRAALAGFGLRAHAAPAVYVVPDYQPQHRISDAAIDRAIDRSRA